MAEATRAAAAAMTPSTQAPVKPREAAGPAALVAVAIVSYGRPEDVMACLAALERSSFAEFEVVIVENAGSKAFDRLSAALATAWSCSDEPDGKSVADPMRASDRCRRWRRYL